MSISEIKFRLWKTLANRNLSVSHDQWHIDEVEKHANELRALYGGDEEVLDAAVILHDLGRIDPELRGQASASQSAEWAEPILKSMNFPSDKIPAVLSAIEEHDKPEVMPSTIEGRILKEADFLAGFGAWGLVRIAMWAAETKGGVDQILDRLSNRMPARMSSLGFPEATRKALRDYLLIPLVTTHLLNSTSLAENTYPGKYIILEGNSGVGKNTQAALLERELMKRGFSVKVVEEAGDKYKALKSAWGESADPAIKKYLYMADRYALIQEQVMPALREGSIVISIRSFVSTLVYQCTNDLDVAEALYEHRFVPPPDLIILYDLPHELAMKRIEERHQITGVEISSNENPNKLGMHRQRYLKMSQLLNFYKWETIPTNSSIDDIADKTWCAVQKILVRS